MGVYIKNMEKPKGCRWCPLNHDSMCYVIQPYKTDETNGEQCRNNCPLIEIDLVRCGECKHLEVINKAPIYAHCHKWDYDFELWQEDTRTNFCSWAERRADDSNT